MISNKIEIPSVTLLDENCLTVKALKQLAQSLGLEFGWHYLLDLTWVIQNMREGIGSLEGKFILDAGAGTGMMQWFVATQGAEVLSVDRGSRADLPVRFRRRFNVAGLRQGAEPDLLPASRLFSNSLANITSHPKQVLKQANEYLETIGASKAPGRILIYNQDLKNLVDVLDNSVDAVVAISSLEHNPPQDLPEVVTELMRVLKPGGILLATLCAAPDRDWYHEPSAGWCYTERTLRRSFNLPENTPANYAQYDELFTSLRNCAELRDNLADFYSKSGDNGMPWGKWDPQYQPVGVCKIKET
jgi:ubiquinone/menaquinone biosynthesis C-methylase UbiE